MLSGNEELVPVASADSAGRCVCLLAKRVRMVAAPGQRRIDHAARSAWPFRATWRSRRRTGPWSRVVVCKFNLLSAETFGHGGSVAAETVTVYISCLEGTPRRPPRAPSCHRATGIQAEHQRPERSAEADAVHRPLRRGCDRDSVRPGCHGSGSARLQPRGATDLCEPSGDCA